MAGNDKLGGILTESEFIAPPETSDVDQIDKIIQETKAKLGSEQPAQPEQGGDAPFIKVERQETPANAGKPPSKQAGQPQNQPIGIKDDGLMDIELPEDMLADLYGGLFDILAKRMGEHWALNDTERMMIAKPTKRVLDKYRIKTTPEFALLATAGILVIPRVLITLNDNYEKEKIKKDIEAKANADTLRRQAEAQLRELHKEAQPPKPPTRNGQLDSAKKVEEWQSAPPVISPQFKTIGGKAI